MTDVDLIVMTFNDSRGSAGYEHDVIDREPWSPGAPWKT